MSDILKQITDKDGKPIHGFGINQYGEKVHVSTAAHLGPEAFNGEKDFEEAAGMTVREWEERFNDFLPWSMSSVEELRSHSDWLSDQWNKHEAENARLRAALQYVRSYCDDYAEAVEKDAPMDRTIWDVSSVVRYALEGKE